MPTTPFGAAARWRKIVAPAASGALLLAAVAVPAAPATAAPAAPAAQESLSSFVNPFVGTESEGNAYPGATVPFGMVQLSPNNTNSYASTSYSKNAGRVWGFSHRNINSAGCPAAGEVLVTPTTTATPATTRAFLRIKDQASTEKAQAGSYEVQLQNDVKAELTATTRTGVHRYTFPATGTANLSFNVGQSLNKTDASSVRWVDDRTLEGTMTTGGFCWDDGARTTYHFSARFDRAPQQTGVWNGSGAVTWGSAARETASGNNGAVARFDTTSDRDVEVSIGVSFVDVEGARANRTQEVSAAGGTFDSVKQAAHRAWDERLSAATIQASTQAKRVFYTQLYKSFLSPTIGSDVDGRYRGMDGKVHEAKGWDYHQTFSLWDTYRTQAALHALFAPKEAQDIVRSMERHRVEGGWLPRWSLGANETNVMAGDPVSAWVAENFAFGTVPEDIADSLWGHLIENATTTPPAGVATVGRRSADFWIKNGHIPFYSEREPGLGQQFEEYRHGGSASMEFAVSDASIGNAAARTGRDGGEAFRERGTNWQRLWNPDVKLTGGFTGMVNAVRPDGTFVSVPEKSTVLDSGFHEGTAWQYQWMAMQDVEGLQKKMGGREEFLKRLDYYFSMNDLKAKPGATPAGWARGGSDYYSSIGYNPGNEPTIMNPWLYNAVGQPAKVNDVLAANLNRFPDTPGGGVGNDDLGTLSSWYVMATLGFQPVTPGSGLLALNSPRVEAATLRLGDKSVTITAAGAHESLPRYTRSLSVDGAKHEATWIDVNDLRRATSLNYELSATADGLSWGTARDAWLPSTSAPLKADVTASVKASQDVHLKKATEHTLGTVSAVRSAGTSGAGEAIASWRLPVRATLTVDGQPVPVRAVAKGDAWELVASLPALKGGKHQAVLTVRQADGVDRWAPEVFAPVTTSFQLFASARPAK